MIYVNRASSTLLPPTVQLAGTLKGIEKSETISAPLPGENKTTSIASSQVVVNGQTVTKTGVYVFRGDVVVTLVPDPKYPVAHQNLGVEFVGEKHFKQSQFNSSSQTFYTFSGKDPKRTSWKLYKAPFTLKSNKSGNDNTVLKVKTYYRGKESIMRTVEFRIKRDNTNNF